MIEKPNALHVAGLRWALDNHYIFDLRQREAVEKLIAEAAPAPVEREAVEVVGWLQTDATRRPAYWLSRHRQVSELDIEQGALAEPLMTVAQHERIVTAKEAEIERLADEADRYRNERDAWIGRATELQGGADELRAQLAAQPAAVPVGWKLVPIEPTNKMTHVGQSLRYDAINSIGHIYRQMLDVAPAAPQPEAVLVAKLEVFYGAMPESNGKSNWTAILHNGDLCSGITLYRSEYPDRVRYEADRARFLIGELKDKPFILDYDADKHSGYVAPAAPQQGDKSVHSKCRDERVIRYSFEGMGCTILHGDGTPVRRNGLPKGKFVREEDLVALPPDAEGSATQKSFWAGFEAAYMSKSSNIREAWNRYKATDEFARLNPSAQGEKP